ncbi:MAG: ABC transporter ATP-binding protein [Desulfovibrio sp.]|nr:ABC transporter ATP-binding protein [Desulfovibrio sp.]
MFLELRGLCRRYDEAAAVDGLDLAVGKGEFVCILGPSGCGKTTTIGMVGGFVTPTRGRILLDGEDVTALPPHVRPICTVFQNYALFPHLSVLKNVVYGLKFRGVPAKRAARDGEAMLDMMGLPGLRDRRVTDLSGGEQQRVALARALILKPKVLLLDEPLTNRDARLRFTLRKEIKELQTRLGITMLYVTHDQEEALGLADRMVVMNAGRIEQIGAPEEVYTRPRTAFVARFLGRANLIRENGRLVLVRPEDMTLSPLSGRRRGTVAHRQFSGPITTYFVDVGQTRQLEVDMLSNSDARHTVGEAVYVDWRRDLDMDEE